MNECSVAIKIDDELLALGDITPRILKRIKGRYGNSYNILKVPHHATKSYYYSGLPKSNYKLISNSGPYRMDWSIDGRYYDAKTCICINDNPARCDSLAREMLRRMWNKDHIQRGCVVAASSCIIFTLSKL
ncbi:hypothetical protein [Butyrivibrio sp. AD3002]|uniref:hypothetical protein n=1 Tax=Butyrivibrio sp. AD3002 TaxID=1280670 RepID=UPI0003B4AB60|nr:hypothetical protein [Butyrivibrio sp. AD3002]